MINFIVQIHFKLEMLVKNDTFAICVHFNILCWNVKLVGVEKESLVIHVSTNIEMVKKACLSQYNN
jgi:hypothetical protein